MKIDDNPRLSYPDYMDIAYLYMPRRRDPNKRKVSPGVAAPTKTEGSRFHAKG